MYTVQPTRSVKFVTLLIALSMVLSLSLFQLSTPQSSHAAASMIVGYIPSWRGEILDYQTNKITHALYAFALANADGSLQPIENPAKLQALVNNMHSKGKKVLLSVGGWNQSNDGYDEFDSIAANATYRTNFANNLLNLVNQYNLDGVDIDWEYPEPGQASQYTSMMQEIRNKIGSGKLLTAAVCASAWCGDGVSGGALSIMNYIFIMAYDGADGAGHSPYSLAVSSLDYWSGRGVPASKLVLGVPFYSRPGWHDYRTLRSGGCSADADSCVYNGQTTYYNGRPTMRQKIDLVNSRGASGVMIWELSQDTTSDSDSLLKAIADKIGGGTQPPPPPPAGDTYFQLVNRHSGKCADVSGGSTGDGVAIQQWTCTGSNNQQWQLVPTDGGYYRLVARHSGKCADMGDWSTTDGGRLVQWPCHGGANQQWRFYRTSDGWFRVQHRHAAGTAQYLSVSYGSTADGAYLHQWSWLGNPDQQWRLQPVGSTRMINRSSNKCVDLSTSQGGADGSNIHQWTCHSNNNQKWRFQHAGDGYYRVVSDYNGKVMEVNSGSQSDGANVRIWTSHSYHHAQWRIEPTGDGYVALFARHSGKVLDVNACGSADGTNIQQWSWYNNNCQRFKLAP